MGQFGLQNLAKIENRPEIGLELAWNWPKTELPQFDKRPQKTE
jgi:hypothetical protein